MTRLTQFSLRGLFLVLFVAALFAWVLRPAPSPMIGRHRSARLLSIYRQVAPVEARRAEKLAVDQPFHVRLEARVACTSDVGERIVDEICRQLLENAGTLGAEIDEVGQQSSSRHVDLPAPPRWELTMNGDFHYRFRRGAGYVTVELGDAEPIAGQLVTQYTLTIDIDERPR